MNELLFTNDELGIKVRTIKNDDGSISINAEDAARGFGWTRVATSGNDVVRWERINGYIKEYDESCPQVGTGDYIPESMFYLLGMKASNEKAKKFQKWLAVDVIPDIRRTGSYSTNSITEYDKAKAEMELVGIAAKILNLNDNSKLLCMNNVLTNHNIPTNILPQYTESKGQLLPATELLKRNNIAISAIKFNKLMMQEGLIEEKERPSSKGIKKFKSLVDTYWGENQVSDKNPKETQVLYYENKFEELLHKLNLL